MKYLVAILGRILCLKPDERVSEGAGGVPGNVVGGSELDAGAGVRCKSNNKVTT